MKKPARMEVVHRAYELWEKAGKPEGRDQEFYHQAERELRGNLKTPKLLKDFRSSTVPAPPELPCGPFRPSAA